MGSSRLVRGVNDFATLLPEAAAEWDYEKNNGLRPDDIMAGADRYIYFRCARGHEWRTKAYHRKEGHGCPFCTSVEGRITAGINDLASNKPELMLEWDSEKNCYDPGKLGLYSQKKVWWICPKGHSWRASVHHRAVRDQGCPYCSGQKMLPGFNDLAATMPGLAAEWNYERNKGLDPSDVMAGSDRKVWWRCSLGHEWEAYLYSRKSGNGCPFCSGQKVLKGFNDLATAAPMVAADWDDERNRPLAPDLVTAGTSRRVWWICPNGHSWQASIASRALNNRGCPYCSGKRVLQGVNDLASQAPEVAAEWDPEKNNGILPETVTAHTHYKAWWRCIHGHSYPAEVADRVYGTGCPYCSGKKVMPGFNDLLTTYPDIAAEWNYEKNTGLGPEDVTAMSNRRVWWICSRKHEWRVPVSNRHKTGCPFCSNKRVLPGFNDLETVHPDLAAEWNAKRNGSLKPSDVVYGSHRAVWWRCSKGHEWRAAVISRHKGNGCPVCGRRKDKHVVLEGVNDLSTLSPVLTEEWDWDRNGELHPGMFRQFSNREVWWKCKNGHHWRAKIQARQKGNGCPYCIGKYPIRARLI